MKGRLVWTQKQRQRDEYTRDNRTRERRSTVVIHDLISGNRTRTGGEDDGWDWCIDVIHIDDEDDTNNTLCSQCEEESISGSVLIRIITQSRSPHKFQVLNDFSRIQGLSKTLPLGQRSCGTSINHTTHRFSLSLAELLYLHWDDAKVFPCHVVPGDLRCTCAVLFSLSLSDKCKRGDGFGKWINCDETRQLSFLGYEMVCDIPTEYISIIICREAIESYKCLHYWKSPSWEGNLTTSETELPTK